MRKKPDKRKSLIFSKTIGFITYILEDTKMLKNSTVYNVKNKSYAINKKIDKQISYCHNEIWNDEKWTTVIYKVRINLNNKIVSEKRKSSKIAYRIIFFNKFQKKKRKLYILQLNIYIHNTLQKVINGETQHLEWYIWGCGMQEDRLVKSMQVKVSRHKLLVRF